MNFDKYMYSCKHQLNQNSKYFHYSKTFFPCPFISHALSDSSFNSFCSLLQTLWLSQCWIFVFFPQYTILSNPVIHASLYITFYVIFLNLLFRTMIWFTPMFISTLHYFYYNFKFFITITCFFKNIFISDSTVLFLTSNYL